jgi:proline iminopeptidase
VAEQPFEVDVRDGLLHGSRAGSGPPALLLHGGPGLQDYTEACAAELAPLLETFRYTQRGVPPSTAGLPCSVERHMDDALAVLDAFDIARAWAVGHSWGGQLALHLAVAHPDRLLGIICIDPLGAFPDVLDEYRDNFRTRMPAADFARFEELEAASEDPRTPLPERERLAIEGHHILWPYYFADPARSGPDYMERDGIECGEQTSASVAAHFESWTLANGLPRFELPVLFVHGLDDPLPVRCSTEAAALMPDATVETIDDCGHFPWLEKPGALADAVGRFLARS